MRLVLMVIVLLLSFAASSYAVDEVTYVSLTADAIIAMHNYKGNVAGMNQWITKTQEQNPEFMTASWQAFEANVASNPSEKTRVYNKVLGKVRSRGYKAHISNLGDGLTAIEIE